jgi:hypothetical protein
MALRAAGDACEELWAETSRPILGMPGSIREVVRTAVPVQLGDVLAGERRRRPHRERELSVLGRAHGDLAPDSVPACRFTDRGRRESTHGAPVRRGPIGTLRGYRDKLKNKGRQGALSQSNRIFPDGGSYLRRESERTPSTTMVARASGSTATLPTPDETGTCVPDQVGPAATAN